MSTALVKGFSMPFDVQKFSELYDQFLKIDFTGTTSGIRPPLKSEKDVRAATARGVPFLPLIYRQNFHAPMDAALPQLMLKLKHDVQTGEKTPEEATTRLEQFYAPVYQHGRGFTKIDPAPQLRRFLAVVSNLFRSFTDKDKRASAGVDLVTTTPPLAFFQMASEQGPYTIESDLMRQHFATSIGIVSLPATYRDHPVAWSVLSHEVCGHDVVHADDGLLQEMTAAVQALLSPDFSPRQRLDTAGVNALIWSYWMDEAAADVYGVLNMGPAFGPSLAAFLAAFRARILIDIQGKPRPQKPTVSTDALARGAQGGAAIIEDHPIDILRLHLVIGAIEAMTKLDDDKRVAYIAELEKVALLVTGGAGSIELDGIVNLASGMRVPVKTDMPLPAAAEAARKVGHMIATARFKALNGHSIQEIETWDDDDEAAAEAIAARVLQRQPITGHGDDAQLLAGVTLALLREPGLYDAAQALLNDALDDSFRTDPIWGDPLAGHAFARHGFTRPAGKKPLKKK